MNEPTLDDAVRSARLLAESVDAVLLRIPAALDSPDLERRAAVLRAQVVSLRSMRPDASGFLPQRLTWSMGQSVAVVLPSALRRLVAAGFVTDGDLDRCLSQAAVLSDLLRRYETS